MTKGYDMKNDVTSCLASYPADPESILSALGTIAISIQPRMMMMMMITI